MNILNDILLVAGALFIVAMVLICLGLFLNPRKKSPENFDPSQYMVDVPQKPDRNIDNIAYIEEDDSLDEETDNLYDDENQETPDEESESIDNESNNDDKETEDYDDEDTKDNENSLKEKDSIMNFNITVVDSGKTHKAAIRDELVIGRNPKCDIVINQPMISSIHCILIYDNNKLMIEDDNSTNGTMLNGKHLKHLVEVKNNDVITLGDCSIKITF